MPSVTLPPAPHSSPPCFSLLKHIHVPSSSMIKPLFHKSSQSFSYELEVDISLCPLLWAILWFKSRAINTRSVSGRKVGGRCVRLKSREKRFKVVK
jgi:hypothetical protein